MRLTWLGVVAGGKWGKSSFGLKNRHVFFELENPNELSHSDRESRNGIYFWHESVLLIGMVLSTYVGTIHSPPLSSFLETCVSVPTASQTSYDEEFSEM
jgi:hypothetical protein